LIESVARQSEFENIGQEVEKWAHKMLFEEGGEENGWKEVKCNKMVRKKFNARGQTTCYLKVSYFVSFFVETGLKKVISKRNNYRFLFSG
jgi:hypothetical protein